MLRKCVKNGPADVLKLILVNNNNRFSLNEGIDFFLCSCGFSYVMFKRNLLTLTYHKCKVLIHSAELFMSVITIFSIKTRWMYLKDNYTVSLLKQEHIEENEVDVFCLISNIILLEVREPTIKSESRSCSVHRTGLNFIYPHQAAPARMTFTLKQTFLQPYQHCYITLNVHCKHLWKGNLLQAG